MTRGQRFIRTSSPTSETAAFDADVERHTPCYGRKRTFRPDLFLAGTASDQNSGSAVGTAGQSGTTGSASGNAGTSSGSTTGATSADQSSGSQSSTANSSSSGATNSNGGSKGGGEVALATMLALGAGSTVIRRFRK